MRICQILMTLVWSLSVSLLWADLPKKIEYPPLKWSPPSVEKQTLSNGIKVFLLPDSELPLIHLSAYIRTGQRYDLPHKVGVAKLCGTLLRTGGTKNLPVKVLDEQLEFLGASINTSMKMEHAEASLSALTQDFDSVLEWFADILQEPLFNRSQLEIERGQMIEQIRRRNDSPFKIARREFRKQLYGPDHPLAWTTEIPTLDKISRRDILKFYKKYYHPNNMWIAVSGDFKTQEMIQKLEMAFSKWKKQEVVFPKVKKVTPPSFSEKKRFIGWVQKDVTQTSLIVGHLGIARHHPDRFKLEVLNEILGGGSFTSRLFKEVRTRLGLAYGVGSSISEPWDLGIIAVGVQTKNQSAGQTLKAILNEIGRLQDQLVTQNELATAKESILNSFIFNYSSAHAICEQEVSLDYLNFPSNYLNTYLEKIDSVTREDIQSVAKKYFYPDQMTILAVGNESQVDIPFSEFGTVEPLDVTIDE